MKELFFIDLVRDDLERVEALLREHYSGQHRKQSDVIRVAVDHLVTGGGKRLRPALVLLSAYLCEAKLEQAVFAAAAVEMLHTATLIHDDLIDGALVRRGTETLNANWSPSATVLTGDYVFAYAAYLAAKADNVRLMQRFSETLMIICDGEVQQMFNGRGSQISLQKYEQRIYAKTASLIAMSAEAGPILAGAEEKTIEALRVYGEQLGLAFQIVDDVLDFVADEDTLGKPVGSDLRQGLITLPSVLFLQMEPKPGNKLHTVRQAMQGHPSQELVQQAVQAVVESPAIEQALEVAQQHADRAKETLNEFKSSPYKAALLELADFTVRRRF
ncbi:MAG: polyprenyl synthetase family protein [Chloroflexi bacterium]|nr:polyprenyl synthetase family protein [Chloroflexota bacterium]